MTAPPYRAVRVLDESVLQRNLNDAISYITACLVLSDILKALQDCLSCSKGNESIISSCNCPPLEGTLSTDLISSLIDLLMLVDASCILSSRN